MFYLVIGSASSRDRFKLCLIISHKFAAKVFFRFWQEFINYVFNINYGLGWKLILEHTRTMWASVIRVRWQFFLLKINGVAVAEWIYFGDLSFWTNWVIKGIDTVEPLWVWVEGNWRIWDFSGVIENKTWGLKLFFYGYFTVEKLLERKSI